MEVGGSRNDAGQVGRPKCALPSSLGCLCAAEPCLPQADLPSRALPHHFIGTSCLPTFVGVTGCKMCIHSKISERTQDVKSDVDRRSQPPLYERIPKTPYHILQPVTPKCALPSSLGCLCAAEPCLPPKKPATFVRKNPQNSILHR
jgi:hypothetical protein